MKKTVFSLYLKKNYLEVIVLALNSSCRNSIQYIMIIYVVNTLEYPSRHPSIGIFNTALNQVVYLIRNKYSSGLIIACSCGLGEKYKGARALWEKYDFSCSQIINKSKMYLAMVFIGLQIGFLIYRNTPVYRETYERKVHLPVTR